MSVAISIEPATDSHTSPRTSKRRPRRRRAAPYLFVLPFVVIFIGFSVYPMLYALRLSFTNWKGAGDAVWVGLGNYTYLLTNPSFWTSLLNSAVIWLLVVPIQVAISMLAAVALNNSLLRGRGAYRSATLLPYVTPLVAMAQVWIVAFDQNYGAVNRVLGVFGLPEIGWLTSTTWSKPTVALLFLWKTTGFAVIIMLSGLQSIPHEIYEAAALDGASRSRQLWSLTVPLVRRTMVFLIVLQTLAVFQMFAEPFVLTKGGPFGSTTTAGLYLYKYIDISDLGTGAANSFLLVLLVMALSLVSFRLMRSKD